MHQPSTSDDNNVSLLIDAESSVLKLKRLVCLIILHGGLSCKLGKVDHFVWGPKK